MEEDLDARNFARFYKGKKKTDLADLLHRTISVV